MTTDRQERSPRDDRGVGDEEALDMRFESTFTTTLDLVEKLNRAGGEFLLADAETAHTFLDMAQTTNDRERARRDFNLAAEALQTIKRYLPRLDIETGLRRSIEVSVAKLHARLQTMGPRFGA